MCEKSSVETGSDVRVAARSGYTGFTVGRAPGYVQANVYIVPHAFARHFLAFCNANPIACPILGRGETGSYHMPALGRDIDIRTDLPSFLINEQGVERLAGDIGDLWQDDFVVFAVGCWLGAEGALAKAGIRMRHRELGLQGGLYRTHLTANAVGPFHGPLIVSMRPFRRDDVDRVISTTAGMPLSHGAPLHVGDPAELGIKALDQADWGDVVLPNEDETAVFWPCGLTALQALKNASIPFFISHAPGAMLVTDLKEVFA
ncbi:D-glutamate cyclase family protein [Neorhizobium galegae]|uniref:D-glutamate cyclase family protein n=1 Tax=Neorhizobium galegae TaxID=399 RepID=UPI000627F919|nr:DUF1445 domain-containing protein [Neorhizobium galegae]KAB1122021.1 DUF1445 domain-containing protein [Neorhizobium galegae]MCQ1809468.1 DUF1445 domain-containing protein [Neorhizobium galegae]